MKEIEVYYGVKHQVQDAVVDDMVEMHERYTRGEVTYREYGNVGRII